MAKTGTQFTKKLWKYEEDPWEEWVYLLVISIITSQGSKELIQDLVSYISCQLPWLFTSSLKMETACFSETLPSTYETTRRKHARQQPTLY
jgi:hypothetical protein